MVFAISWRLPVLSRRSKVVRFTIGDEVVEHYARCSAAEGRTTEAKITSAIREMLADYDPAPDCGASDALEVVQWKVSAAPR